MPLIPTRFGALTCDAPLELDFPAGVPGFEQERRFLLVEPPATAPLAFLQAVTSDLCFLVLPVRVIDPEYELRLGDDDLELLDGKAASAQEALAIVCVPESGPATANLLGPIVIHRGSGKALQAVRDDARYSARHPLERGPC